MATKSVIQLDAEAGGDRPAPGGAAMTLVHLRRPHDKDTTNRFRACLIRNWMRAAIAAPPVPYGEACAEAAELLANQMPWLEAQEQARMAEILAKIRLVLNEAVPA